MSVIFEQGDDEDLLSASISKIYKAQSGIQDLDSFIGSVPRGSKKRRSTVKESKFKNSDKDS